MATKTLRLWNGRPQGKYASFRDKYPEAHTYIAAYNRSHAARLLTQAMGLKLEPWMINRYKREIKDYFSEGSWGNKLSHIPVTEPVVYVGTKNELIKLA